MDNIKKEALISAGINVNTAMQRFFDDEEMYFTFLNKFLSDDLIDQLDIAISENDAKKSFDIAHTMKGVCANLSIDSLNAIINPMVEVLRKNSLIGLDCEMYKLKKQYEIVTDIIRQYC